MPVENECYKRKCSKKKNNEGIPFLDEIVIKCTCNSNFDKCCQIFN